MNNANLIHQNSYKNNARAGEESRRQRREYTIELRKSKKEHELSMRRNIVDQAVSPISLQTNKQLSNQMNVEEIARAIQGKNKEQQFFGMQAARKMLSVESITNIDMIVRYGIVPIAIRFLNDFLNPALQFEAAWVLISIASGNTEHRQIVIKHNAIPQIVALLQCNSANLVEHAVWVLGKIANDNVEARNMILSYNIVTTILKLIHNDMPLYMLRIVAWLMSNLCDNKISSPPLGEIQLLVPVLSKLLCVNDVQVMAHACCALSYFTASGNDMIQIVVDTNVVPQLIAMLGSENPYIVALALRTVGNIASGTNTHADQVIKANGLQKMAALLYNDDSNIMMDAAWTIGNITAGNQEQIQAVLDANLFTHIRQILVQGHFLAQREAARAVTNATINGSTDQVKNFWEKYDMLKPLSDLLSGSDTDTIHIVLIGLSNIFLEAITIEKLNYLSIIFEEIGGLHKVERLQYHENEDIYEAAYAFIDAYFSNDYETDDEFQPQVVDDQLYFDASDQKMPNGGFSF
ncbi:importin subunit alpha-like [Teleopsis dalmanni]|nr:importin subunit alpha-like [Teleopsis dalmanni]